MLVIIRLISKKTNITYYIIHIIKTFKDRIINRIKSQIFKLRGNNASNSTSPNSESQPQPPKPQSKSQPQPQPQPQPTSNPDFTTSTTNTSNPNRKNTEINTNDPINQPVVAERGVNVPIATSEEQPIANKKEAQQLVQQQLQQQSKNKENNSSVIENVESPSKRGKTKQATSNLTKTNSNEPIIASVKSVEIPNSNQNGKSLISMFFLVL